MMINDEERETIATASASLESEYLEMMLAGVPLSPTIVDSETNILAQLHEMITSGHGRVTTLEACPLSG